MVKIRATSSAVMELILLCPPLHDDLGPEWKFGGCATAVICSYGPGRRAGGERRGKGGVREEGKKEVKEKARLRRLTSVVMSRSRTRFMFFLALSLLRQMRGPSGGVEIYRAAEERGPWAGGRRAKGGRRNTLGTVRRKRDARRGSGGGQIVAREIVRAGQKRDFKKVGVAHTMGWMSRNKLIRQVFLE